MQIFFRGNKNSCCVYITSTNSKCCINYLLFSRENITSSTVLETLVYVLSEYSQDLQKPLEKFRGKKFLVMFFWSKLPNGGDGHGHILEMR